MATKAGTIKRESAKEDNNHFGIAGLALSIFSLIVPFFGIILAILGIVFSVLQQKKSPNGIATAGLVIGIISIILHIVFLIAFIALVSYFATQPVIVHDNGTAVQVVVGNLTNITAPK